MSERLAVSARVRHAAVSDQRTGQRHGVIIMTLVLTLDEIQAFSKTFQ